MGLTLVDSSTIIGYLDATDLLHDDAVARVEATVAAGNGLAISAVTWAELLHGALLGHRAEAIVRGFVEDFGVEIVAADAAIAERAAELKTAYAKKARGGRVQRLKTPDAFILATADLAREVDLVLAGDDQWPERRCASAEAPMSYTLLQLESRTHARAAPRRR